MWCRAMLAVVVAFNVSTTAAAQDGTSQQPQQPETETAAGDSEQEPSDPDLEPNPSQPDFSVVNLPTTLRLPQHKAAFRVTHRFARPLGEGSFSDLLSDFFGFDSGAQIGLEVRFGLFRGTQVGIHRTSDRTIEFFGQYNVVQQAERRLVGLSALVTVEGANNFQVNYTPAVGAIVSREFGEHGAFYVIPLWLGNTNLQPGSTEPNDTFLFGIGARYRLLETVYLSAEYNPRLAGFQPGTDQASFAIEKRVGGHLFQLNFSNGFGTTMGQIARGGVSADDWFIGFNISRKFY